MITSPSAPATLGSANPVRRAVHVAGVSLYLAAVTAWLAARGRLDLEVGKVARFLARKIGGPRSASTRPVSAAVEAEPGVAAPGTHTPSPASAPLPPSDGAWRDNLFVCPTCAAPLHAGVAELTCPGGHVVSIVRGIPRFVPSDDYARSFSLEWNTHHSTQLDSAQGAGVSEETLREKTGLTPRDVNGRLVLDAGVGSGRFSEVLALWGARVVGVDLSLAVEAAARNLARHPDVQIAQADIFRLPFAPGTFDVIVSIGVLHHTPDTRRAFEALVPLLKPGGAIVIWVYPDEGAYKVRNAWIPYTSRIPPDAFYDWCRWLIPLTYRNPEHAVARQLWKLFPYSRQGLGVEWDVLDTFDGFSPRYHGTHSVPEVEAWFRAAGLIDVHEAGPIPTAVCGRRPDPA